MPFPVFRIPIKMKNHLLKLTPLILLAGAILRIIGTGSAAIWHDEAVTLYRAGLPLISLIKNNSEGSGDLLLEGILGPLIAISHSHSLWMLRLPSMIASVIMLWLIWELIQWMNFNPTQQIITAVLIAFLPGLIWMAQDCRSYALLTCFYLAAIYYAFESNWLGVIACCGLMEYCHNTAPAYILSILAILFYLYPWKIRKIILTGILIGIIYIPQALILFRIYHLNSLNTITLQPIPPLSWPYFAFEFIMSFWVGTLKNAAGWWLFLILMVLSLGLFFFKSPARPRTIWFLGFIIPLAIITGISIWNNVLIYRTIMPLIIPFLFWLGWELGQKGWAPGFMRTYLAILWIYVLLIGVINWHPANRGGGLDQVAASIRSQWQAGDVMIYTSETSALPFDYYLNDKPHVIIDASSNPFLNPPGLKLLVSNADSSQARREWIIIPQDALFSKLEWEQVNSLVAGLKPIYQVKYIQTSQLNVYLVKREISNVK